MSAPPITIGIDSSVEDAAGLMLDRNIGAVIVVDAVGNYAGLLTERSFMPRRSLVPFMRGEVFRVMGVQIKSGGDIQNAIDMNRDRRLGEVLNVDGPTARPDSTASELAELMLNLEVNHVPIIEDGRPVGIVSRHDFLRMFVERPG
jgi:CBS domain-containing protein